MHIQADHWGFWVMPHASNVEVSLVSDNKTCLGSETCTMKQIFEALSYLHQWWRVGNIHLLPIGHPSLPLNSHFLPPPFSTDMNPITKPDNRTLLPCRVPLRPLQFSTDSRRLSPSAILHSTNYYLPIHSNQFPTQFLKDILTNSTIPDTTVDFLNSDFNEDLLSTFIASNGQR